MCVKHANSFIHSFSITQELSSIAVSFQEYQQEVCRFHFAYHHAGYNKVEHLQTLENLIPRVIRKHVCRFCPKRWKICKQSVHTYLMPSPYTVPLRVRRWTSTSIYSEWGFQVRYSRQQKAVGERRSLRPSFILGQGTSTLMKIYSTYAARY